MSVPIQTSSFRKRENQHMINVAGTKMSAANSSLLVSTGVPSLDAIIDGGLPLGSLCFIEEDVYGSYSKIVTKYFLAEGVLKENYIFSASKNDNPWDLPNSLPSPIAEEKNTSVPLDSKEELKIAWRYENLSLESSSQKAGTTFDLSASYCLTETQKNKIAVFDGSRSTSSSGQGGTLKNPSCFDLVQAIHEAITKWNLDSSSNTPNLLRIVVSSFGSPYWQLEDKQLSVDFTTTLMLLKAIVRCSNAVAIVTIPHQLLDKGLVARSRNIADVVLRLKSVREDPHLQDLMDVHGILEMKKVINLTSLKPLLGQDGTTTYGFKATKRKFKIEKLHLPPAVEDDKPSSSSQDFHQPSASGCGSAASGKANLDF